MPYPSLKSDSGDGDYNSFHQWKKSLDKCGFITVSVFEISMKTELYKACCTTSILPLIIILSLNVTTEEKDQIANEEEHVTLGQFPVSTCIIATHTFFRVKS